MNKGTRSNSSFKMGIAFAMSLAAGLVLLSAFLYLVGLSQIVETIRTVNLQLMLVAFLLDMAGLVLYGTCWYALLKAAGLDMRFRTCISIALAGIFTCYITPSGFFMDASRVLLASKESNIRLGDGAATVILHKIMFTLGFVTFGLLALGMLFISRGLSLALAMNILGISALVVLGTLAMALFIVKADHLGQRMPNLIDRMKSLLDKIARKYHPAVLSSISGVTNDFRKTFLKVVRSPKAILTSYALALSYWTTSVLIMYVVFMALGYDISIWAIVLTISIGDFIQMTPIAIPGMLGVIEVVTTTVLVMFGVPLSVAASATLLARIATFWFDLPVTGMAASYYGAKYVIKLASSASRTVK
jgi:uncharacterized protein (TIRG00374 family)